MFRACSAVAAVATAAVVLVVVAYNLFMFAICFLAFLFSCVRSFRPHKDEFGC